jgi:hypothetical protein
MTWPPRIPLSNFGEVRACEQRKDTSGTKAKERMCFDVYGVERDEEGDPVNRREKDHSSYCRREENGRKEHEIERERTDTVRMWGCGKRRQFQAKAEGGVGSIKGPKRNGNHVIPNHEGAGRTGEEWASESERRNLVGFFLGGREGGRDRRVL